MDDITTKLGVRVESGTLGLPAVPVQVSPFLHEAIRRGMRTALLSNTEKARSEFLVAPVLDEVAELRSKQVSLFSGVSFDVSPADGLVGTVDFLFSGSKAPTMVPPILAVVEAKNDNLANGYAQCISELIGADRRNSRRPCPLYGAVTTGTDWQLISLDGERRLATLDDRVYQVASMAELVGTLLGIIDEALGQLASSPASVRAEMA